MISLPELLHDSQTLPLYEQLYRALAEGVRTGGIAPGEKLPGKRSLAAQLGVSVNTVETAYQLLEAEGYLEARPRSGFYAQEAALHSPAPAAPIAPPAPQTPPAWRFDLGTDGVDTALFPFRTWGRIQKELLYSRPELLARGQAQGDENLRCALAAHLQQYRGVHCLPEQIVVGAGIEYLLGLLARLLGPGALLAVENPGYARARRVFENEGVACCCVPVDEAGLSVKALEAGGAGAVYVTPSHQFPTGVTMPAGRRAALLRWAAAQPGRLVIEDDYDSEFRFATRPLPSLQGMDGGEHVAYVGTFSKSLAPSIRIAYMVLPKGLTGEYARRFGSYSSTVSRFEQQTLYRFLAEGHFARHQARLRSRYQQRMQRFAAALQRELGPEVELSGQHTGLHLLARIPGADEAALAAAANAAGLRLAALGEYLDPAAPGAPRPATLVLGYGALDEAALDEAARALAQSWKGLVPNGCF